MSTTDSSLDKSIDDNPFDKQLLDQIPNSNPELV
jgi:hypothetical protein